MSTPPKAEIRERLGEHRSGTHSGADKGSSEAYRIGDSQLQEKRPRGVL